MNYIKDINLFENGFYNMIIEIPKGTNILCPNDT